MVTAGLQTASVAYCQRKIQLSGFSAHPDGWPSQLIRISRVLLCLCKQTRTVDKAVGVEALPTAKEYDRFWNVVHSLLTGIVRLVGPAGRYY